MKLWLKTLGFCFVVLTVLIGIKAMEIRSAMAMAASFPEPFESVEVATTRETEYAETITVPGIIHNPRKLTLLTEVPGRIVKIGFTSGQKVNKGDLLLKLDTSEETALLNSANARLKLANSILKRHEKLFRNKAVSQEQLDRSVADLATIKAEIARLESLIRKKTIKAPFAGFTGLHSFEVGQFVFDGIEVTRLLSESTKRWVDFSVPQVYRQPNTGDMIEIKRSDKGEKLTASIVAGEPRIDPNTRSIQYRATLEAPSLPDNTAVNLTLPVTSPLKVIEVPLTAIQHDHAGTFLYALTSNEGGYLATPMRVRVIGRGEQKGFIAEGIDAGVLIAADGAFKLTEGIRVHPKGLTEAE